VRDKRLAIIASIALLAAVAWCYALIPRNQTLDLAVLDVGEGQCTVIRTAGGRTLVVDCGTSSWRKPEAVGRNLAARYLNTMGVDRIDVAILSHPHADHISGLPALLRLKPAKLVLDIGADYRSPRYREFLAVVKASRARYRRAVRGQVIEIENDTSIEILNPSPNETYTNLNDRSIALRLRYRNVAFLLAGDTGEEAEAMILRSGSKTRAQVLVVGHHGSAGSCTPGWLSAVNPKVAIVSAGRGNKYGHPSPDVLDRLSCLGAKVYRTDRHGAVVVSTDGKRLHVRTFSNAR